METKLVIFSVYASFGFFMFLFNLKIANFFNNLVLYFTNKLKLKDLFIFRVDNNNKDFMFSLMKFFTITFALCILLFSIYEIYIIF